MKKMITIHNSSWDEMTRQGSRINNNVAKGNMIIPDWEQSTYIRKWQEATPKECEGYRYVLLILLPEQNELKMARYQAIIDHPGRKYKVLIYIPDVVGWQMHPFLPKNKRKYMNILSGADYVLRVNLPETESYWKALMRGKLSYFMEGSYLVEMAMGIKELDLPMALQVIDRYGLNVDEPYIFVGKSLKNINEERNIMLSFYVAGQIQKQTGWKVVCFANNPLDPDKKDNLYKDICGVENVIELPIVEWRNYIRILTELNIQIGIYLDCLETRGQVALDCACSDIALLCSGSIAGRKLYPSSWINNCRDVDSAVEVGFKIVNDVRFRKKIKKYATENVWDFSRESTLKKLEAIIGEKL